MKRFTSRKKALSYILIILLFFLVAEVMLRIRERVKAKETQVYGQINFFSSHPFLNYVLNPKIAKHNSLGFRGQEIDISKEENIYRIFCLGASSVYGSRVSPEESYPYFLNQLLKNTVKKKVPDVINAGVPGYTSANIFLLFQFRILPLSPDMIIIYSGFNDIFPRIMGKGAFDYSDFNIVWRPIPALKRALFKSILAQKIIGRVGERLGIAFLTWPPHIHEIVQKWPYQYVTGDYKRNLANTSAQIFQRNILSLIQLARANDVDVVLVAQVLGPVKESKSIYAELAKGIMEHNNVIRNLTRQTGVYLIDLESIFPRRSEMFIDEIHMSPKGNKIRAEIISETIAKIIQEDN